jgi:hypothetical protein
MSRNGDEDIVPSKFDDEGNLTNNEEGSKSGASTGPTLEKLTRRLEKLTAEKEKLRAKVRGKKTKGSSSSSKEEDSSFEEEVSKKGKKGRRNLDKPSYNSMSFNCNNMPSSTAYTSIPVGKAPYFDGTSYNQWMHCMKIYLYSIKPEAWQVICDGVDFLDEDEEPSSNQLQQIHRNAQAISILTSSIDKEEFNYVDGLDVAKDVWTTLRMAHEGNKPVRKAKVEMLERQLNWFIIYEDGTTYELLNLLNRWVNKARALGS